MKHRAALPFGLAVVLGAAVCPFSVWIAGHTEPWHGDGTYHFGTLALTGLIAGLISPKPTWAFYTGVFFGQLGKVGARNTPPQSSHSRATATGPIRALMFFWRLSASAAKLSFREDSVACELALHARHSLQ